MKGSSTAYAYGLGNKTGANAFFLGEASGLGAAGGAGSSIGKVSGAAIVKSSAYFAFGSGFGTDQDTFLLGLATGSGKVVAGSSSVGAGTGVYGSATVTVTSTDPNAKLGTVVGDAFGMYDLQINVGNASSTGAAKGNYAYGAYGQIGKLTGTAVATDTTAVGVSAYGTGFGIANYVISGPATPIVQAGDAAGYGKAYAGKGVVGAVFGSARITLSGGTPTVTSRAYATGLGSAPHGASLIGEVNIYAGYATATAAAGIAMGGTGSAIASVKGQAYAYAVAGAKAGVALSTAIGIDDSAFDAGNAFGVTATGGAASIGTVFGVGKATATGFAAAVTSKGIDPSVFSDSNASAPVFVLPPVTPSPNITAGANGGVGTIGAGTGIYGYAYGSAQSAGGTSLSLVYGIQDLTAIAGFGATKSGTGTIGNINGTAKSYALDSNKGSYTAVAHGIYGGNFNAANGGSTSSAIGNILAVAVASNSAGKVGYAGTTGAGARAAGIYYDFKDSAGMDFNSGGSIGAVTAKSYQGAGSDYVIFDANIGAGTTIGIVKAINGGTGSNATGIDDSTFVAGTSISGLYLKIATTSGDAFVNDHIRAINTNGTGATAAIGYITAKTGSGTQSGGIDACVFTTTGSIGAINVTGSVFGSKILAGDDIGSTFALTTVTATTGASIGNVNVSGYFVSSDMVASVTNVTSGHFGNSGDTGTTGTLGTVSIGHPTHASKTGTTESYAVEAGTIGTVTWGTNTITTTSPGTDVYSDNAGQYIVVRAI